VEDKPICIVKSKNFIEKVMFLMAVASPQFDEFENEVFPRK